MEKTETVPGVRTVKMRMLAACAACAAAVAVGLFAWRAADSRQPCEIAEERAVPKERETVPATVSISRVADEKRGGKPRLKRNPEVSPAADADGEDAEESWTPNEKALAVRIEKALDAEDLKAAVACADEALKCSISEIRQNVVDTLGWFGEKALPELTPFLADADDDVRESAMNEWTMALSSIEDEGERIRVVELAMGVIKDEEVLEDISNEYIGADEKLAVESLVRIIDGNGPAEGVAKAKETYEFVTGDEWTDSAAAERWIAEEYEPPEEP